MHPVVGGAVLAGLGYVAVLGVWIRTRRSERAALAARHARFAPLAYGFTAAMWLSGVLSTWLLRTDLEPAASLHFRIGSIIVGLLTASALSARHRSRHPDLRELHPWLGAAAVMLAAAQVLAGLQITP